MIAFRTGAGSAYPLSSWWPTQCLWVTARVLTVLISRQREENIGRPHHEVCPFLLRLLLSLRAQEYLLLWDTRLMLVIERMWFMSEVKFPGLPWKEVGMIGREDAVQKVGKKWRSTLRVFTRVTVQTGAEELLVHGQKFQWNFPQKALVAF